ncbi:hypothetical protein [Pseudomarimonas arenosa]|uniref:Uncharacterized protein n=1 Tax=Pseudomarimonas arenosa TaxID=2774145 RepID=A0AAW3ZQE5_9GAMM|nr:hypothetical protein [Pseudomarimonas arenosa]MBD8526859.1 hypothetical protein [Pseudomarimonas arenosa]
MAETPIESRLHIPSRTTPTWEVELLISGAVVFALLQAMAPLEQAFIKGIAIAAVPWDGFVLFGYVYGKLVLSILVGTFILHIAARAAWVALVGAASVFPAGPQWQNLSGGPIARRLTESLCGDLDAAVERADNRAALVFAYGILAAQFSIAIFLLSMLVIGVSVIFHPFGWAQPAIFITLGLLIGPMLLAALLDKLFGKRLTEGGWGERALRFTLRSSQLWTLGRLTVPLMPLIITNVGGKRGNWVMVGVIYLAMAVTFVDITIGLNGAAWIRGESLPEPSRRDGTSSSHYASERSEISRYASTPYLPDRLVEGPYLRLMLPYVAEQHDPELAEHCAPARDAGSADDSATTKPQRWAAQRLQAERTLNCFVERFAIRLNDRPLKGLQGQRARDPFSDQDGVLVMIDVRDLPPGMHQLELRRSARQDSGLVMGRDREEDRDLIKFWR